LRPAPPAGWGGLSRPSPERRREEAVGRAEAEAAQSEPEEINRIQVVTATRIDQSKDREKTRTRKCSVRLEVRRPRFVTFGGGERK